MDPNLSVSSSQIMGAGAFASMASSTEGVSNSQVNAMMQAAAKEARDAAKKLRRVNADLDNANVRIVALEERELELEQKVRHLSRENPEGQRREALIEQQQQEISVLGEEITALNDRLSSHLDALEQAETLKTLCRQLGVTEDELNALNVKGVKSELETMREQVKILEEEVLWLEKERAHWLRKVRMMPLLDAQLRLKLGLTEKQQREIEQIVQAMKSGRDYHGALLPAYRPDDIHTADDSPMNDEDHAKEAGEAQVSESASGEDKIAGTAPEGSRLKVKIQQQQPRRDLIPTIPEHFRDNDKYGPVDEELERVFRERHRRVFSEQITERMERAILSLQQKYGSNFGINFYAGDGGSGSSRRGSSVTEQPAPDTQSHDPPPPALIDEDDPQPVNSADPECEKGDVSCSVSAASSLQQSGTGEVERLQSQSGQFGRGNNRQDLIEQLREVMTQTVESAVANAVALGALSAAIPGSQREDQNGSSEASAGGEAAEHPHSALIITELRTLLQERTEVSERLRKENEGLVETSNVAMEERDRYRDLLLGRQGSGLNITTTGGAGDGDGLNRTESSTSLVGLRRRQIKGDITTADDDMIDNLLAIESVLRKQLAVKDAAIKSAAERFAAVEQECQTLQEECGSAKEDVKARDQQLLDMQTKMDELSLMLTESHESISHLEKIKADLLLAIEKQKILHDQLGSGLAEHHTVPSMRNTIHSHVLKIVQLRDREAKLVRRIRLISDERDTALHEGKLNQQYLNVMLSCLRNLLQQTAQQSLNPAKLFGGGKEGDKLVQMLFSAGGSDGEGKGNSDAGVPTVLPSASYSMLQEKEMLHYMQLGLDRVAKGELLAADEKVVVEMRQMNDRLTKHHDELDYRAQVVNLRAETEKAKCEAAERAAEVIGLQKVIERLEDLKREEEQDANTAAYHVSFAQHQGGGVGMGASSSAAASLMAEAAESQSRRREGALGKALVEAETWKQKCFVYTQRADDRATEINRLQSLLDESRIELAEVKSELYAARVVPASTSTGTDESQSQSPESKAGGAATAGPCTPHTLQSFSQKLAMHEREVARQKSANMSLLRVLCDLQSDRRRVEAELALRRQQITLLSEQQSPLHERAASVVSQLVRQNAQLTQEVGMATSAVKSLKIQLAASDANVRVAVNEAGAYKQAAYRL